MQWQQAISEVRTIAVSGPADIGVRDVQYDSRRVQHGDVFVAMRGDTTDGNRYVDKALNAGAAAIITDSATVFGDLSTREPRLPLALVEHGRRALAEISAAVFDHPERKLKISAVTGTNGKTTTAFLLAQLLRSVGRKCILLGTIETRIGDEVRVSEHTTPESRDLYALFADGVRAGCTEVVMEASSHALAQERVWGLPVDVALFTNLTQDHLDFHGTMEEYARAKARLFEGLGTAPPRVGIIRANDPYAGTMQSSFRGPSLMTYGVEPVQATHRAEGVQYELGCTRFRFVVPGEEIAVRSPLNGRVNVENLLAAMCAALARGVTLPQIAEAVAHLEQVPGRFQVVPGSKESGITVVVDYAHTEDALRNLIQLARETVGEGRVITLFGCGGDRDRGKRPKMGRAAGEGSDLVIITSDNPRSEDPMAIIEAAAAGVHETGTEYRVEPDRRAAIELALKQARLGDVVLLAGKGHEKTQTFPDRTIAFDDVAEAEKVLREVTV